MSAAGGSTRPPAGVAVGWCGSDWLGRPIGSDAAIVAALAHDPKRTCFALRRGGRLGAASQLGLPLVALSPPLGRPCLALGGIRSRVAQSGTTPVWAEPDGLGQLRGFARAAMTPDGLDVQPLADRLLAATPADRESGAVSTVLVMAGQPSRIDARTVIFVSTLASVSDMPTRVVLPAGTRHVDGARRYLRRLSVRSEVEILDGPAWAALPRANAVIADLAAEQASTFGPVMLRLAEAMGRPVLNLPFDLPVGGRDAREFGLPLCRALDPSFGKQPPTPTPGMA